MNLYWIIVNGDVVRMEKKNKLGEGLTLLLNVEGYMCCVGQFSLQLNKNLTKQKLLGLATPDNTGCLIPLLTEIVNSNPSDTKLTREAITINDDYFTTPEQKVELLKELFSKNGYTIKVINKP